MGKTFYYFLFHMLPSPLISSYPPRYIYSRFKKFLNNNISNGYIIPLIESKSYFELFRSSFLNRPTAIELQIAPRIAKVTDHHNIKTIDTSTSVSTEQKQISKCDTNLIIHYIHEKRLETLIKDIHQLWNQIFHNTPIMNTKLIIGHKNNSSVAKELVQRRPCRMPKLIQTNQTQQTTSLDTNITR